jgi:hypothetical protein
MIKKVREQFYFVIVIPVTKDNQGPCDLKEAEKLTWEVWTQELSSVASFDFLPDAIDECNKLNEEHNAIFIS